MSDNMRVAVIGLGTVGAIHADAYLATKQADIVAVCDENPNTLAHQGDRLNVNARFSDYRRMLEKDDVEAVSICVGNALHRQVAIDCLRSGKHILLEKPMALNAAEAVEVAQAGTKAGRVLQIGMTRRQKPDAQIFRSYVERGLLGEIYHMRCVMIRRRGIPGLGGWFTTRSASGGGPLIDLGVHWLDMAMWLSGHWNPTTVSGQTYAKFGPAMENYKYVWMWAGPPKLGGTFDVEDYATGLVRFSDKATLMDFAWAANAQEESYVEVLGTKGGGRLFTDKPMTLCTEFEGRPADIQPLFDSHDNAFAVQAEKFLAACRGEIGPVATAEQGITVMKIIDGIYASGKLGREVAIG